MYEKSLEKLKELEKRLEHLTKKLPLILENNGKAPELEQKLKKVSESLARERALREDSGKSGSAKLTALEAKAKKLEQRLAQERKLREEIADRIQVLVSELEEEKAGK